MHIFKILIIILVIVILVTAFAINAKDFKEHTNKLHEELINAYSAIEELELELYKLKGPKPYTEEDVMLLAKVMYHENGYEWFPNIIQLITGSVVLNRVADKDYPNTIHDVVYAPGQYGCAHNGSFNIEPSDRAIENAKFLLEHGSIIPENVVYQSGEPLGSGIYFTFYDSVLNSIQYFSYK